MKIKLNTTFWKKSKEHISETFATICMWTIGILIMNTFFFFNTKSTFMAYVNLIYMLIFALIYLTHNQYKQEANKYKEVKEENNNGKKK